MEENIQILTEHHKVLPGRINDAVTLMRCISNLRDHVILGPRAARNDTEGGIQLFTFQRQKQIGRASCRERV